MKVLKTIGKAFAIYLCFCAGGAVVNTVGDSHLGWATTAYSYDSNSYSWFSSGEFDRETGHFLIDGRSRYKAGDYHSRGFSEVSEDRLTNATLDHHWFTGYTFSVYRYAEHHGFNQLVSRHDFQSYGFLQFLIAPAMLYSMFTM